MDRGLNKINQVLKKRERERERERERGREGGRTKEEQEGRNKRNSDTQLQRKTD